MKFVNAVRPYISSGVNFKDKAYSAWCQLGGGEALAHYPPRWLHGVVYRWELPIVMCKKKEARLRFIEPISIQFDTFPDYALYDIIPFIWDCWPSFFELTCSWLERHRVKTAFFTSSQTAEKMRMRFPDKNIIYISEGINTLDYGPGKELKDRQINLLEFGRSKKGYFKSVFPENFIHYSRKNDYSLVFQTYQALIEGLADSQITVNFPKCDTDPQEAGDIETLTQRYWESMLSRCVMVGRAPKELMDIIGYNPVVELENGHETEQVLDMVAHIEEYQGLVDKNRESALKYGDWGGIMRQVMNKLIELGYRI